MDFEFDERVYEKLILECLQENKNSSIKTNFCHHGQKFQFSLISYLRKSFSSFFLFWVVMPTVFALSAQASGVRKLPPVAPAQLAYNFSSSQDENILLENCVSKANSPKPRVSLVLSVESGSDFSRGCTLKTIHTIETKTVHTGETESVSKNLGKESLSNPKMQKSEKLVLSNILPFQGKGKTKQKAHEIAESSQTVLSRLKSLKSAIQEHYELVQFDLTHLSTEHRKLILEALPNVGPKAKALKKQFPPAVQISKDLVASTFDVFRKASDSIGEKHEKLENILVNYFPELDQPTPSTSSITISSSTIEVTSKPFTKIQANAAITARLPVNLTKNLILEPHTSLSFQGSLEPNISVGVSMKYSKTDTFLSGEYNKNINAWKVSLGTRFSFSQFFGRPASMKIHQTQFLSSQILARELTTVQEVDTSPGIQTKEREKIVNQGKTGISLSFDLFSIGLF